MEYIQKIVVSYGYLNMANGIAYVLYPRYVRIRINFRVVGRGCQYNIYVPINDHIACDATRTITLTSDSNIYF